MRVEYIHEKGTGVLNEDSLLVGEDIFGVFDGATSLDGATFDGWKTGGYLASSIAWGVYGNNDDSLYELSCRANTAIYEGMVSRGVDVSKKENLWSTSAAVVKIGDGVFEWAQTGDSLIMAIDEDNSHRLLVDSYDHDMDTLLMWKNLAEESPGTVFDTVFDQIRKVRTGMNVDYGVLNGEEASLDFFKMGVEPLDGLKHLVIFTDGLFIPKRDPRKKESFDRFASLYLEGGLEGVRNHVRELQEQDPFCREFPRFKPHDDIAAVSISF